MKEGDEMAITIVETAGENTEHDMSAEIILQREVVRKTCQSVIDVMKNELPEEAHTVEVFEYILQESGSMLRNAPLKL